MDSRPVASRKYELRAEARQLAAEPDLAAAVATQTRLLELPECRGARVVALYAASSWEVSTQRLAEELAGRGARLLFPRVEGRELELAAVEKLDELRPGYRGIFEPPPESPQTAANQVDLFVIPGVLFDRHGRRLGRGGGHYDRLLARARPDACRVGLCYARRVVEEIPVEAWDMGVNVLVTEDEAIRVDEA